MLWKSVLVAALLWYGLAGTAAAQGLSMQTQGCGDPVADAFCMTEDLLFGPSGVLPFTTHQVEWARTIVFDVVFVILPLGGAL